MTNHLELCLQLENEIRELSASSESYQIAPLQSRDALIRQLIEERSRTLPELVRARVRDEFYGTGPLQVLVDDLSVTEIIVNGPCHLWFERNGRLSRLEDQFASDLSYRNFCHRILDEARVLVSSENPTGQGCFRQFRLHVIGGDLTGSNAHFCLRRHPENPWTFQKLADQGWGSEAQRETLVRLVQSRTNFLVVGATGSGKTSVLNACLQSLSPEDRGVLIEDTLELKVPNSASMRLLTRDDPNGILKKIDQAELVKNSLRLRPDRIIMGEIRGEEAKDFLMALSTGHPGSFGSLHAATAAQALIRLEMLIQLGAPRWSLMAIRRLIQMSLQAVVVIRRNVDGKRDLEGIYRISSLEENGILLEKTC